MQPNRDELLRAYRTMRAIRGFEERITKEFEAGNIPGFIHLYAGQEAVAAGVCAHLTDRDKIGSTHRGHGHCIAKGCSIKGMMHELMARADGLCKGKGGSMHIADFDVGMLGANAIVGGNPPICVGAALAAKSRGDDFVAVSFAGDGASNQGTTFEAMNLAVVLQLPVIFVLENNGYGEATGVEYHVGSKDMAGRAAAMGMPAEKVDGTDFFAVYQAAGQAVERARQGGGPAALEVVARRFGGHFVGDPQVYRSDDEREATQGGDPLTRFRERVLEGGILETAQLDEIDQEVAAELDAAVDSALAAPKPTAADLESDVYVAYA